MRFVLPLALLSCLIVSGCRKPTPPPTPKDNPQAKANPAPPQGGNPANNVSLNPATMGGSGGAVQAVRKAVGRAVNQNELKNLQLTIEFAFNENNKMPTAAETLAALKSPPSKTAQLVEEGAIVLTGTRDRAGIWAYTADAQSTAGYYLVLKGDGVHQMYEQDLRQALGGR